jgi:hypothetical protein
MAAKQDSILNRKRLEENKAAYLKTSSYKMAWFYLKIIVSLTYFSALATIFVPVNADHS